MARDTSGPCVVIRNCYCLQVGHLANGMGPVVPEEKIGFKVAQVELGHKHADFEEPRSASRGLSPRAPDKSLRPELELGSCQA